MGTHVSFIFRGYNPYIGGSKPSFFMGCWGSKGGWSGVNESCRGSIFLVMKMEENLTTKMMYGHF